jgi:hypothetical protein
VLNHCGKKVSLKVQGADVVFALGKREKKKRKTKPRIFDNGVLKLLKKLWFMSDFLCSKRLAAYLRETLPVLVRFDEIEVDETMKDMLTALPLHFTSMIATWFKKNSRKKMLH